MDKAALESALTTLDIWLIVFGVLVAIGVVGESVVGYLHWRRSGQLQIVQNAENLTLQGQVADAQKQAADAQLALDKFKAPRRLSPEQQTALSHEMRPYAGTPFTMAVFNDKESNDLLGQIFQALVDAGWKPVAWQTEGIISTTVNYPGRPNFGLTNLDGVYIQADERYVEKFGPQVNRLAALLDSQGIWATGEVGAMPKTNLKNIGVINVMIGQKKLR